MSTPDKRSGVDALLGHAAFINAPKLDDDDVLIGNRAMAEFSTPEQIGAALDPAGYLGAARQFTGAALAAHAQYAEHAG